MINVELERVDVVYVLIVDDKTEPLPTLVGSGSVWGRKEENVEFNKSKYYAS